MRPALRIVHLTYLAAVALLCLAPAAVSEPTAPSVGRNLLRNGSFEGGLLYWNGIDPKMQYLVAKPDAPDGKFVLRSEKRWFLSAPMLLERGKSYTLSLSVRGDVPGEIHIQVPPTARERAQGEKRIWDPAGTQVAKVGKSWQRLSFKVEADLAPDGFWVDQKYAIFIEGTVPIELDALSVTPGTQQEARYVPRRPLEVVTEVFDLPEYTNGGGLLKFGQDLRLAAHVSNPSQRPAEATVRVQLMDYEGTAPRGEAIERKLTLLPGATLSETFKLKLAAPGTVLARSSVWLAGKLVDQSDFPVTSLPYPKAATKPDPKERFGGSYFGPVAAGLARQIGFGWARWYPFSKWQDVQPNGPGDFRSVEKELKGLEALGQSAHLVLYGWPKWIMDGKHPLPKDMRWGPKDPRWSNLKLLTAWDRFIKKTVESYKDRAVIFEIENEPELDHWDGLEDEYAQFTLRTAKQIKRWDPNAKVMVNNLFTIPSGINRRFLEIGGAKYIDVISWHEYREGWLADEALMTRMRTALDELGAKHVEIWFNEGWSFTNTAVDQPTAATRLTSAQSTNAMFDSVAELTAAGQEKTILFILGYETHGTSFWDYYGPGTSLWDWYGYPLPLIPAWNVLAHHLGLSDRVGSVRPPGANLRVFQDLRNGRGVIVAYADRESAADVTLELPFSGLSTEDAMGYRGKLIGKTLTLSKTGRPVLLYADSKTPGQAFWKALEPLDRKYVSFVSPDESEIGFPPIWKGKTLGSAEGNPQLHQGKAIWRLDQVYPDVQKPTSYRPLTWDNGWWKAKKDTFGDQPKAEMKGRGVRLEFRAPNADSPGEKLCGLVFVAPKAGSYWLSGTATMRLWDGLNPVRLTLLKKTKGGVQELRHFALTPNQTLPIPSVLAKLNAGEELVILPRIDGILTGGEVTLEDLVLKTETTQLSAWKLPSTWEGPAANTLLGNPWTQAGQPIFRLDQLTQNDFVMAANYKPLRWNGGVWSTSGFPNHDDAYAKIQEGRLEALVRGPTTTAGQKLNQQTVALSFIVPRSGTYRLRVTASTKPSKGKAKSHPLVLLNKDTQRALQLKMLALPKDGSPVKLDIELELAAGHELLLLPLISEPDAVTLTTIENLTLEFKPMGAGKKSLPAPAKR